MKLLKYKKIIIILITSLIIFAPRVIAGLVLFPTLLLEIIYNEIIEICLHMFGMPSILLALTIIYVIAMTSLSEIKPKKET